MKPPCLAKFTLEKISKRAEKSLMLPKSSFKEILKSHMNLETPSTMEQPKFEFRAEPLLHFNFETSKTTRARTLYGVRPMAPRPKLKMVIQVSELDVLEQACLQVLGGGDLETLTEDHLKKLYRRKSFSAHPDHGGSSDDFLGVADAYRPLAQLFRS